MPELKGGIGGKWRIVVALPFIGLTFLFASLHGAAPAQAQASDRDVEAQIIGGTDVPDNKYLFMAALLDKTRGSTAFQQQFCGATLIDADSVLTAAHCVRGKPAWSLSVVVGRTVLDSTQGQLRNVSRINVYPGFNPTTQAYDVAVLRLSSRVVGIAPIKLATATQNYLETPGRTATAAGWGNTIGEPAGPSAAGSYPQRMREARVPLVSDAYTYRVYTYYFPALMVAAGRTGKDTCQGDSGGPLFTWVPGSGYTQVGITSFGIGCGAPGYPGVYAEVNNPTLRSFITYWAAR